MTVGKYFLLQNKDDSGFIQSSQQKPERSDQHKEQRTILKKNSKSQQTCLRTIQGKNCTVISHFMFIQSSRLRLRCLIRLGLVGRGDYAWERCVMEGCDVVRTTLVQGYCQSHLVTHIIPTFNLTRNHCDHAWKHYPLSTEFTIEDINHSFISWMKFVLFSHILNLTSTELNTLNGS